MEQNVTPVPAPVQPASQDPVLDQGKKPGLTAGVWSIVCAIISLLFIPPLFGILGIYLGYRSKKQGQQTLGTVGIALSIVCMVLGMFIGAITNVLLKGAK